MLLTIVRSGLGEPTHEVEIWAAVAGATVISADRLGMVSNAMRDALGDLSEPVIFGGGRPVDATTAS